MYIPAPATGVADNSTSGYRITEDKLFVFEETEPEFGLCDPLGMVAVPALGPNGDEETVEVEAVLARKKKYHTPIPARIRIITMSIIKVIFVRFDMVIDHIFGWSVSVIQANTTVLPGALLSIAFVQLSLDEYVMVDSNPLDDSIVKE